jgi:hypothetical protein
MQQGRTIILRDPAGVPAPDCPRSDCERDAQCKGEAEELPARGAEHADAHEYRERREEVAQPVEHRVDRGLRLEFRGAARGQEQRAARGAEQRIIKAFLRDHHTLEYREHRYDADREISRDENQWRDQQGARKSCEADRV